MSTYDTGISVDLFINHSAAYELIHSSYAHGFDLRIYRRYQAYGWGL